MEIRRDIEIRENEGKKAFRREVKARRAARTREQIHEMSGQIAERFLHLPEYLEAACIYAYMDCKNEVETRAIIEKAWADGKRVAVPRVRGEVMDYHYIEDFSGLEDGYYGIREPLAELPVAMEEDALMILPGVAFDEALHRVGYGGGFYDRYQEAHPGLSRIALALNSRCFHGFPLRNLTKDR